MPVIGGPGAYQPIGVDLTATSAGPAYTNPRQAMDLVMWNGGASTVTAYDTGGSDSTSDLQAILNAAQTNFNAGVPLQRIRLNSRSKYNVAGSVVTGSHGELAQLILPYPTNKMGTLEIIGGSWDGMRGPGVLGYQATPRTVIESTLGSAPTFASTTGIASIIGGPASYGTNNTNAQSQLHLGMKGMSIRSAAPVIAGLDSGHITGLAFDDLVFDTDAMTNISPTSGLLTAYYAALAAPPPTPGPQAIPIIMPLINNVFGVNGGRLSVTNWLCGPVIGEYGNVEHIEVFGVPGCALCLDSANQPFRIGTFIDLDNAYGIGGVYPTSGNNPFNPTATGGASNVLSAGGLAGKVDIGTWMIQPAEPSPTAPASWGRVYDAIDNNNVCEVNVFGMSKTVGGSGVSSDTFAFFGAGAANGVMSRWRAQNRHVQVGTILSISPPGSGVTIRNPYARDAVIYLSGSITNYSINGAAYGAAPPLFPNVGFYLPAQATFSLTYTGTPSISYSAL